ncbi:MAG: hypothetical protein V4671_04745 [Armatimonadota bacterium]
MKTLTPSFRAAFCCLLALVFVAFPSSAQTPPVPADDIKAAHRAKTKAFFSLYPEIKGVISTRVGNSSAGTTEETPPDKARDWPRVFPDGAPMRLAIPHSIDRVGLLWESKDRKGEPLIVLHSTWNEGGWHTTYVTPAGKVIGGTFDRPWNAEVDLRPGKDSGIPGYSWKSDDSGFVMTTPKTTLYSLVTIASAVTDPQDPNRVFSIMNAHTMDWNYKGDGREHRAFSPSFDFTRYPTDPRKGGGGHQQPLAAVRIDGTLYFYTSNTDINIFRWDEINRVMVPVAGAALRPDTAAGRVPAAPPLEWGQGVVARTDTAGNFAADRYEIFDAKKPFALWNGYQINVHETTGDIWFLPAQTGIRDAPLGAVWKTFDLERGVLSPDNLTEIVLPRQLHTAGECVQMRIHWKTGDLYAVVQRDGVYRLEKYAGWRTGPDVKPVYSVGPVALSKRRSFEWWLPYDKETGAPYDPAAGFMVASHGTLALCGDYAFLIEGQSQGIRVHRLSDGAYVGRYFDRQHQNSSQDDPNGISVTETKTEYRIFVMDFHGKSTLVRRIPKSALTAALTAALKAKS